MILENLGQIELEQLSKKGWVTFHFEGSLLNLGNQLGTPLSSRPEGEVLQELKVESSLSVSRNSLSGRYGIGAFPFHTDGAYMRIVPRFVLLRSQSMQSSTRPTLIKDILKDAKESELKALKCEQWIINSGRRRFYSPVISSGGLRIDFDVMKPVSSLNAKSPEIINDLLSRTQSFSVEWTYGLTLLVDNWRVVHARGEGNPNDDLHRSLQRVLLT